MKRKVIDLFSGIPAEQHVLEIADQNVYNKTWWEERVEAVSMAAASVWREFMPTPQVPAAM